MFLHTKALALVVKVVYSFNSIQFNSMIKVHHAEIGKYYRTKTAWYCHLLYSPQLHFSLVHQSHSYLLRNALQEVQVGLLHEANDTWEYG